MDAWEGHQHIYVEFVTCCNDGKLWLKRGTRVVPTKRYDDCVIRCICVPETIETGETLTIHYQGLWEDAGPCRRVLM